MRAFAAVAALLYTALGFRIPRQAVNGSAARDASCGIKGGSGASDDGIAIVNGQPAEECEWKWQVGLARRAGSMPFCGGMLISAEWVLSAAHCMVFPTFLVVAGDHKPRETSGNEQVRRMLKKIPHPHYSRSTFEHDYALVQLESPMELNSCVGTVCLPEEGQDVAPGSNCWITGWGTLRAGGYQPDVLQEGEVSILSNSDCKETGYPSSQIRDSMICAQGKTADGSIVDACQGDSGGPLVCQAGGAWRIFGATSWGRGCAGARFPGIWSRVHNALEWIDETMAQS